jgi:YidC/Oxa1 family membrane protein insertase
MDISPILNFFLHEWIASFIRLLLGVTGNNYGLAVILFTVILKTVMLPLDIWSRKLMHKSQRSLKKLKPQLDAVQEQYGHDRLQVMQRQRAIKKAAGHSDLKSMLPMVVTMVVFIMVFGGFNLQVRNRNADLFEATFNVFETHLQTFPEGELRDAERMRLLTETDTDMLEEVRLVFIEMKDGFIWIGNLFMPDVPWRTPIPRIDDATTVMWDDDGNLIQIIGGDERAFFQRYIEPLAGEEGIQRWNGFLILPLLSIALNFLVTKLNPRPQTNPSMRNTRGLTPEQAAKQAETSQKMAMFTMPLIMGVFALMWSAALGLYIFTNSLYSSGFGLIFKRVQDKKDKEEDDRELANTFVKKSKIVEQNKPVPKPEPKPVKTEKSQYQQKQNMQKPRDVAQSYQPKKKPTQPQNKKHKGSVKR